MFKLNNLLKNTSIVGVGTIISRVTGYMREFLMNAWLGASAVSDALIVATRIPTLLRKVSTEGSLNGVLIPLIDELEQKHHKNTIANLINAIILIFSTAFIGFFIFETMFSKASLALLAPGILNDPARLHWFSTFIPFTSLAIVFFFLGGVFSALLNYNQKFFLPSIVQTFWNLVLIIFVLSAQHYNLDYTILGPAFLIATIIQSMITFIPYLRLNIGFKINFNPESRAMLRQFFKNFFPVMFSASISQINSVIIIILTSFLPLGNTTFLYRSERLLQIPIGLILALCTPLLPTLTKTHNENDARKIIRSSLVICALVFVPMSIIFFFWSQPLVKLVFFYGRCTMSDVIAMAGLLKIFAFGVPAFLLIRIMPIFFFARRKISVTTKGAILHTTSSIILSVLLMYQYNAAGLALASVIASWLHVIWLTFNLIKHKYI